MNADIMLDGFARRVQYWNNFFGMTTADMQFAVAYSPVVEQEAPSVTYKTKITTFTLGPKAVLWDEKKTDLVAFTSVFAVFTTVLNGYGLVAFYGDKYKDSDEYKENNERYTRLRMRLLRIMQTFVWPIIASGQGDEQLKELMKELDSETAGSD